MESHELISIITINYKQSEVTNALLDSLKHITWSEIEILIVDNNSGIEELEKLNIDDPKVKLIISSKNLGFAGGNNLGIKHARGKYLLFLNNDTEIEPGFMEPLVELIRSDRKIGMISPKLVYYHSDNKSIIQYAGARKINLFTGRGSKTGFKAKDDGTYDDIRETNLPHGAAMLVPMHVIKEVGLMPEVYFLYYEEHDWAEMIKRASYKIYYCGKSKVYHKESVSVGKDNPLKIYYMNRNRIIFLRRNAGMFAFLSSFLFYTFISLPKNFILYMMNGQYKFARTLISAYFWNFTHFNVRKNKFLESGSDEQ